MNPSDSFALKIVEEMLTLHVERREALVTTMLLVTLAGGRVVIPASTIRAFALDRTTLTSRVDADGNVVLAVEVKP